MEQLSFTAKDVVSRCAGFLKTSEAELSMEFLAETSCQIFDDNVLENARNFMEYCMLRVVSVCCSSSLSNLAGRPFTRLTFDIMVAWESPTAAQEEEEEVRKSECLGKKRQDKQPSESEDSDADTSLFYSDLMPLLVEVESSVGCDAFIKLAPAIPLVADVVTATYQFQALTESTSERLPYPVYHNFVEELHRFTNELATQSMPLSLLDLAQEGEFVLYVDGCGGPTRRIVRHVAAGNSHSGRLTLTTHALYFEKYGTSNISYSYEKALRFDLTRQRQQQQEVKPCSAGPWGLPLFDKGVMLEASDMDDALVLEFFELTGSSRRDYWLALIREIIAVNKFIKRFSLIHQQEREALARAVLGVVRLNATRETFRVFPPQTQAQTLLPFTLADELLPGGHCVLEALAKSITIAAAVESSSCAAAALLDKTAYSSGPSAASTLLHVFLHEKGEQQQQTKDIMSSLPNVSVVGANAALERSVLQSTQEAKKTQQARASIEAFKTEGISHNAIVLKQLISPAIHIAAWFHELITWKRPMRTTLVLLLGLVVIYMEWASYVVSGFFGSAAAFLIWVRRSKLGENFEEIVISTHSDHGQRSTMESVISAQHAVNQFHSTLQTINVVLVKIFSIALSKPTQHTNHVIAGLLALCVAFLLIPFKVVIMGSWACLFIKNIKLGKAESAHSTSTSPSDRNFRRLRDWWDTIHAMPVRKLK